MKNKNNKSFTLIELLVVIAVLALLATLILIAVKGQREKARIANLLQFSASIKNVLGAYVAGEWRFENNLDDSSGNGNHGSGGVMTFVENDISQLGMAGRFVGAEGVTVSDSDSLDISDAITIEAWIKKDGTGLGPPYIVKKESTYDLLPISDDRVAFWVYIPYRRSVESSSNISDGKWHHVVGTYNGSEIKLFLDGKEEDSMIVSGAISSNDNPLYLGDYLDGRIDEVRIYSEGF